VDPATGTVWVSNRLSTFISIVDGVKNTLIQNLPVGDGPEIVSFVPLGR
jgi:YVTN family beta-propeller protein